VLVVLGAWSAVEVDEKLEKLLEQVHSDRDRVRPETLNRLASGGDEEAFAALLTAIGWLRDPYALEHALRALWYFRGNEALARRAVAFLEEQALGAPRRETRRVAVFPLSYFGAKAEPAYERILRESKDEECRASAIGPLLDRLLGRGDEEALRLVLDNAQAIDVARKAAPFQAFDPDVARPSFLAKLADRRTSIGWCLLLLDALAADTGEDLTELLRGFLRHRSTVLQVAAIRALVARGEEAAARVQLERMRLSPQPHVKVEVIRILTRLAARDEAARADWKAKLRALSGSSSAYDRIAAAAGFGVLGDGDSLVALEDLLDDRGWKVRDAALEVARQVRRKELLEPLIERLEAEEGLMRWKVAHTLERLTGLVLGRSGGAWRRWFAEQGAAFELPSLEAVLALEAQRAAPRDEDASLARFYGLPVRSKNVCFVLDVSGSMSERAQDDRTEAKPSLTRLDVAKRELADLLQRLPEQSRCNFLFFADEVEPWEDRLRPLDGKARPPRRRSSSPGARPGAARTSTGPWWRPSRTRRPTRSTSSATATPRSAR
jgi:hypothetical protein